MTTEKNGWRWQMFFRAGGQFLISEKEKRRKREKEWAPAKTLLDRPARRHLHQCNCRHHLPRLRRHHHVRFGGTKCPDHAPAEAWRYAEAWTSSAFPCVRAERRAASVSVPPPSLDPTFAASFLRVVT